MKLVAGGLNSLGQVLANGLLILMIVIFILIEASSFPVKLHTIFGDEKNSLENFDKFIDTVKQYIAVSARLKRLFERVVVSHIDDANIKVVKGIIGACGVLVHTEVAGITAARIYTWALFGLAGSLLTEVEFSSRSFCKQRIKLYVVLPVEGTPVLTMDRQ